MLRFSASITRKLISTNPGRLGQLRLLFTGPTNSKLHTPREHIEYLQQLTGKQNTLVLYEQLKPRRGITIFSIFFALTMLVQAGVLAEWSIGAAYDMWNTEAETRETIQQGEVLATEQSAEEKERYFDTIPLSSPQSVVSFGGRVLVALTITGIPLFFALKAIQFPQNLVKRVTLIPRGVRSNSHPELQIEKSSIWDQLKSSSGHKVSRNTHYLSLDGLELTRGSVVYTGKGENLAQADSGLPFIFALKRGNINSDKDTSRNNGFLMNLVRGTPFIFDRHAAFWGTPIIWDKLFANYVSLKKKDAEVDLLATTSAQGTASPEHTVSTDISKVHLRSIASAQDITSAVNAALKKKNKRKDKKHLRE